MLKPLWMTAQVTLGRCQKASGIFIIEHAFNTPVRLETENSIKFVTKSLDKALQRPLRKQTPLTQSTVGGLSAGLFQQK
jgi:hypothetical protein